ncbi:restriction endonuclease subunit S [Bartonella sp. HY761]|uniref:restriction endonuclease subunit S n=1 Tax=Bartonella sp. HY761 TaxID=2979330 RepID=UPI002202777F|nr:restriction endonuclease subunit S [Bartonella sp. HY761]UXN06770.1 restriction endonuclease subunit S [Bartonella sp. HY761]
MKQGWQRKKLGEVCDIIGGGTPSKNKPKFYNGDILWATVRDMNNDVLTQTQHKITREGLKSSSSNIIPAGEIVVASRVGLGKVCILQYDTAINQDLRGIIPKKSDAVDRKYLFYWLKSQSKKLLEAGRGATVKGISLPFIKNLLFPYIDIHEQQQIVSLLDEAFANLDRAQAHIEANLKNAAELFENTLSSIFKNVNQDSPRLKLSDASVHFGRGRSRHRPRNAPFLYGGTYPFVQTGDIRNCRGAVTEFKQTYSELGLAQSKLWSKGTVCITIAANIAETGILQFDACFPDSIIGMVVDTDIARPDYVEYMLRFFSTDLKEKGKGSAQDNINLGTFEKETFPFPSIQYQSHIVQILQALDIQCVKLTTSFNLDLQNIAELRQSLLQQAFAGALT